MAIEMNIDWKKVSKTKGYRSLKSAYIRDIGRFGRDRNRYRDFFEKAIGLAMHFSNKWNIPIDELLNYWEEKRTYWYPNFYQKSNLERLKPSL